MTPHQAIKRVGSYHPAAALRKAIDKEAGLLGVIPFRHFPKLRAMRVLARSIKRGHFYQ